VNPIDLDTARCLIDYSGGDESLERLGQIQIEGAVALQNMLVDPEVGFAYLADEVGMGKTYIALGVVAIMRYFKPMLRVLYICPSRNVQEKWDREYRSFVRTNVRVGQGRIRTRDGYPAAPYKSCRNVVELLRAATSGYYADFFIGKDSFSMALSDDETSWQKKRDELKALVPARKWEAAIRSKDDVKQQYARALNYILPHFDLVVIDEAHNFKHDFESSDRNKVLSRVFGFRGEDGYSPKVKRALLLSATPYDRDLNQLRNQLRMVGRTELLPESLENDDKVRIRKQLRRFMVRRLNTLKVNGELLTRNMYRREWRDGPRAEVLLETDEQKLVTALVQKKVGELLTRQSDSPSFQAGLLASFESFADSTRSGPVVFDGDPADRKGDYAQDRHVLARLVTNYVQSGLGRTLPHPKMDAVVRRLADSMFGRARKQLVFVRRVKSVGELKAKLDDEYNEWIHAYLNEMLAFHEDARSVMNAVFEAYLDASRMRDSSDIGGEVDGIDLAHDSLPAKNDTFFAWFFRGEASREVSGLLDSDGGAFPTPDGVRKGLVAKNQVVVTLMEPNWAWYICHRENEDLASLLDEHGPEITDLAGKYISGRVADDQLEEYVASQAAFVEWWIEHRNMGFLEPLRESLSAVRSSEGEKSLDEREVRAYLEQSTLYQEIEEAGLTSSVSPFQSRLYEALREGDNLTRAFNLFYVHKALLSFLARTGHGVIDIYTARLMQGPANLTERSRTQWLRDFVAMLARQRRGVRFSTFHELACVATHLEQIIKNNIPDILEKNREEYPTYLAQTLNPVSPVIGASGETTGRSSQARKFRMPGYPLALISTDVFQEGEDLHTFCDSVVHYGLSGSPVSLEQKTGRVDRVGSMAQRRLTRLQRQPEDHEYIQVTYPYVKESIESLQVRQICGNLNEFIESLHDIVASEQAGSDVIDYHEALANKSSVPRQILKRLQSPYEPDVPEKNAYNCAERVLAQEKSRQAEIEHIRRLVDAELKSRGEADNAIYLKDRRFDIPESTLGVMLRSAKASGELILSLTRRAELRPQDLSDKKRLRQLMRDISWKTFHRTIAIESADTKGRHDLYYNAELLVGGPDVTGHPEIKRIFERMETRRDPEQYSRELSPRIRDYFDGISEDTKIPIDRFGATTVRSDNTGGENELAFEFGGSMEHRRQKVRVYECDNRCIFLSDATRKRFVGRLSAAEIIKHTWARNRLIDLVEFVVDPDRGIVGRVVHPSKNMSFDEFLYCSYTLAVEADALEYLLTEGDLH
jgi:hypothetical protein